MLGMRIPLATLTTVLATAPYAFAQTNTAAAPEPLAGAEAPTDATTQAPPDGTAPAAAEPDVANLPGANPPAADPAPAATYSLPWQLRPAQAVNVVRADSAFAFSRPKLAGVDNSTTTIASTILVAAKVTDNFSPLVRLGLVSNSRDRGPNGTNIENPVLGAIYGLKLIPDLRLGLFLGVALPIGQGGGDGPDPGKVVANQAGILARSAMDNAMFAVNYFTVFPGVDIAFVKGGLTVQGEATLLRLTRARGPSTQDSGNTDLTLGLYLGYFIFPFLSLGTELRHQRWLSTPAAVKADATGATRDNTTFAIGPRVHLEVGNKMWLRPGIAFVTPFDDPMKAASYKTVFIDVPFNF